MAVEPACNTTNDDSYSAKTDTFVEPPDQGANTSEPVASSDLTETGHVNGTNQVTEEPREHDVRNNGVMLTAVTNATGNSAGAKLRCLYTNAQSLISKLDELKLCLVELSPDVLAVTETWLSGNISDNEVALPGYQIYRRDRGHRQGGGIVVYVNDGLAVSDNTTKFACSTEAIWLTIKATGSLCLDVLTVYRPPRTDRIADAQLLEQLEKFSSRPNIMIMGDFNAPGTNWNTLQASGPKSAFDYRLLSKTLNACLTQLVVFPTRTREGQRTNCLDLVFTKTLDSIDEIASMPPLGRSDHVVLMWDYSLFSISHTPDQKRRNVWRGDFNLMRADFSGLDWGSLFTGSANDDWELFKNVLLQLINNHCPLTSSWTRALDDRHAVHIAFIDFLKAFDTVPHQSLIHKLNKIGISGKFLKWIDNFLVGRHQVICIGRGMSDPAMVESGVPQGSVLGPILFLIYVDDAARALYCEVAMFADDMKIWSVIRGPTDEDRLQINLNRLEEWSNRWLLRFNVVKCSILRLGNTARFASTRGYFLGGAALQEVEAQRDLGVLTTSSLKPSAHCSRVAKSAMSVLQLRGDLLQAFRIVKGLDCSLAFENFVEFATTNNLRGHPLKLRTQQARLDVRKFSFSVRVVKPWNELPADVVMSPSIQSFKENLDIFMFRNDQER
nr:unnamed protein product [Spirometra erinaceieuropaei]